MVDKIEEAGVVSLANRRKRAMVLKRIQGKLKNARMRAEHRLAPNGKLILRARRLAVKILKRKIAGSLGAKYAILSPSQKMAIDRKIANKGALIKKLSIKLLPKVKSAELQRYKGIQSNGNAIVSPKIAAAPTASPVREAQYHPHKQTYLEKLKRARSDKNMKQVHDGKSRNKLIRKFVAKEETEITEAVKTGNEGYGFHGEAWEESRKKSVKGQHSKNADMAFATAHKRVKTVTGADDTTAKHYLDSVHGRQNYPAIAAGDHDKIHSDFKKFKKNYKPDLFESVKIEELSKTKLGQYITKATSDARHSAESGGSSAEKAWNHTLGRRYNAAQNAEDSAKKRLGTADRRVKGVAKAVARLTKESIQLQSLEELSNRLLRNYDRAAEKSETHTDDEHKLIKRAVGRITASEKRRGIAKVRATESVEQVDETLDGSYVGGLVGTFVGSVAGGLAAGLSGHPHMVIPSALAGSAIGLGGGATLGDKLTDKLYDMKQKRNEKMWAATRKANLKLAGKRLREEFEQLDETYRGKIVGGAIGALALGAPLVAASYFHPVVGIAASPVTLAGATIGGEIGDMVSDKFDDIKAGWKNKIAQKKAVASSKDTWEKVRLNALHNGGRTAPVKLKEADLSNGGKLPIKQIDGNNKKAGAGLEGSPELVAKYKSETPGQDVPLEVKTKSNDAPLKEFIEAVSEDIHYVVSLSEPNQETALNLANEIDGLPDVSINNVTENNISFSSKKDLSSDVTSLGKKLKVKFSVKKS